MNANSDRIIELFGQATAKKSLDDRAQFLAGACREEPELREQVEALLCSHDAAGGFLKNTLALPLPEPITEKPGSLIGHYKLLQKIGEGGCGVVYMAEQEEPVRRRVALKIIKLGMDTRSVIARFEAERQALALMEHPNIAKVLDAGATETGRPYFVMELVRGVRITDFCDENNLSTRERLSLFVQVCQAIQHAHQKGIIHRDIKPSNILVTLQDGVPMPVVIDFGIAKATQQPLTDKTLFTEFQQFLGTPAYMSPEQAELSRLDVDTRGDIYSLGVLLYELMTGKPPFDPEQLLRAGLDEMRRQIREEEPPRPSTRLSTLAAADLTAVARHRQSEPPKLISLIRGDLDWIVMKALEKNRARRYASASEFAADITRHFSNEPVVARPPSTAYRLQKFVRKHKGPVAATAAIAATIVLLGSLSMWLGARAQQQAKKVRANSILVAAASADSPLLKALLLKEVANLQEMPGRLQVALEAANSVLPIALFHGHEYTVKCATFSPDGSRIVTGSRDGTARLWRVDGTEEPLVLRHENGVFCAAFSPDGARIATGTGGAAANVGTTNADDAYLAYVWRVDGMGKPVLLRGHEERVGSVAFSPDGRRIVTGSEDGTARVWQADGTGEQIVLRGHREPLRSAAFSRDGNYVLTASSDRTARVWRSDGTGEPVVLRGHHGAVTCASFSPDGTRVVTGSDDETIRIWQADGKGEPIIFPRHKEWYFDDRYTVLRAGFTSDGSRVFAIDSDALLRVWPVDGMDEPIVEDLKDTKGASAQISPDASRIIYVSQGSRNPLMRVGQGGPVRLKGAHENDVTVVAFSPDGHLALSASTDTIAVWRTEKIGEPVHIPGRVTSAAFSPDGTRIATASDDLAVRIWRADGTGAPLILSGQERQVQSVAFSPDGARVVASSADGNLYVWPADGTAEPAILRPKWGRPVSWSRLSPDGKRVLVCLKDKTLQTWALTGTDTPATLAPPATQFSPGDGVFSPDGRRVAVADLDGSACVWPVNGSGKPVVFGGHLDEVLSVAFSPDGQRVVSTSTDGTARIWRAEDGHELVVLRGHEGWISSAAFSPDGARVITISPHHQSVRIWRADGTGEAFFLDWKREGMDISQAIFSPDGSRVLTISRQTGAQVRRVTWPSLWEYMSANIKIALTPEQRMKFLGESSPEAWGNYVEAERRLGHKPQVKRD